MPTPPSQPEAETPTIIAGLAGSLFLLGLAQGVEPRVLQELAASYGEDPARWMDRDARVPVPLMYRLWETLQEHLPDRPLGLRAAEHLSLEHFGALAYAALRAATLRDALRLFRRFHQVIRVTPEHQLGIEQVAGETVILARYDYRFSAAVPLIVESALAVAVKVCRQVADGPVAAPLSVEFAHRPAGPVDVYQRFFGCPVHFEAQQNRIRYSDEVMEMRPRSPDPALHHYLVQHLEAVQARLAPAVDDPLADVRRTIARHGASGAYQAERIARSLAVSVRTLQRRVRAEGTTLRALIEEARLAAARDLLGDTRLSIEEVAFLLGYAELRSFNRAFRRWTGETPARFRRR